MLTTIIIITSVITLGAVLTVSRAGEKDGICDYNYIGGMEE